MGFYPLHDLVMQYLDFFRKPLLLLKSKGKKTFLKINAPIFRTMTNRLKINQYPILALYLANI